MSRSVVPTNQDSNETITTTTTPVAVRTYNEPVITPTTINLGTGDARYVHSQGSAAATWTITHNLNKYPSVTIVDSGSNVQIGEVLYNSLDQVTVTFAAAFSGYAYLN
jgi:hypothetical protein